MTKPIFVNRTDFVGFFLNALDNPEYIWDTVFKCSISDYSRTILVLLGIFKSQIDPKKLFESFSKYYEFENDQIKLSNNFNSALKELDGSFIYIGNLCPWDKNITIAYSNPSVKDYISTQIIQDDFLLANLCDYLNEIDQIKSIWNIFKNYSLQCDIIKYPKFCDAYFIAIEKYTKKFDEIDSLDELKNLTIHMLSVSKQLNSENYTKFTESLLNKILNNIYNVNFEYIISIIKALKEQEYTYIQTWNNFRTEIKYLLQSQEYTYISDFTKIVEFCELTSTNLDPDKITSLTSHLEEIIENEIIIETNPDSSELKIFMYDL
jgi:hypothetical protein